MTRRARSVALATALAFTLGISVPAFAKEIDVNLKTGASYSGQLVERIPGDHVTIKLATGEVKRFEWEELAEEEASPEAPKAESPKPESPKAETPKPEAPAAKVKAKPKQVTAEPEEGAYEVTIETAQEGVALERPLGTTTLGYAEAQHWERVCAAPCNRAVPGGEYRIGGNGLRKSALFIIDSPTTINAKLGKQGAFSAGVAVGVGGATLGLVGAVILSRPSHGDDTGKNVGLATIVIGLAMAGVGLVLGMSNSSQVKVNDKLIAKPKSTLRFVGDGFVF